MLPDSYSLLPTSYSRSNTLRILITGSKGMLGQDLAQKQSEATSVLMAGLIAVPQIIVALLSPWIGYHSEKFGRKPL